MNIMYSQSCGGCVHVVISEDVTTANLTLFGISWNQIFTIIYTFVTQRDSVHDNTQYIKYCSLT